MSLVMIIFTGFLLTRTSVLNPDLYFWPLPWVKVESLCRQVMHSCITFEILSFMDLFFLLPNLLHSMVICVWSACSMSVCIRASLFTGCGGLAVLKEEDLLGV